jgi:hypothetical protein
LTTWKKDFLRYWDRTSLMMRIVIGAVLSFLIAHIFLNNLNRPLSKEIDEVKKKLNNIGSGDSTTLMMEELRVRKNILTSDLKIWKEKFNAITQDNGSLRQGESGKVIIDVRRLLSEYDIRFIEEERIVAKPVQTPARKKAARRRGGESAVIDTRMKVTWPDYIGSVDYRMTVIGKFSSIREFLHRLNFMPYVFVVNNITLKDSGTLMYDQRLEAQRGVEMVFELHIPFVTDSSI